jgi:hypothetical protein
MYEYIVQMSNWVGLAADEGHYRACIVMAMDNVNSSCNVCGADCKPISLTASVPSPPAHLAEANVIQTLPWGSDRSLHEPALAAFDN